MEITVRDISNKYKEVIIKDIDYRVESGTLNAQEQINLAQSFLIAAEELLDRDKHEEELNQISNVVQGL